MKTTRFLAALVIAGGLAGCQFSPDRSRTAATSHYDLGTPRAMEVSPCCRQNLALAPVRSAPMLSGQTMWYRQGGDSVQPRAFAISRWSADPAALLEQYLRVALGLAETERFDALPYRLGLKLESMEQEFRGNDSSFVRMIVSATLVRTRDRGLVANQVFSLERDAPEASPGGGAEALSALASELSQAISRWVCDSI